MKLKDYQKKALETAIYPNKGNNIAYPLLKLVGEYGELLYAGKECIPENIIKEAGDNFWYISAICFELNIDIERIEKLDNMYLYPTNNELECYIMNISAICETVGKCIRDNEGKVNDEKKEKIITLLQLAVSHLKNFLSDRSIELDEVLKENIKKLNSRKERGVLQGEGDNR